MARRLLEKTEYQSQNYPFPWSHPKFTPQTGADDGQRCLYIKIAHSSHHLPKETSYGFLVHPAPLPRKFIISPDNRSRSLPKSRSSATMRLLAVRLEFFRSGLSFRNTIGFTSRPSTMRNALLFEAPSSLPPATTAYSPSNGPASAPPSSYPSASHFGAPIFPAGSLRDSPPLHQFSFHEVTCLL